MACRREGAWSNGILKEYTQRDQLDDRDAALASRLCYGVLQNRLRLDFILRQLLTGKLRDLHPVVRDILHLGLYQLFFMDKIPESAAVNESVLLAKSSCKGQRNAAGLVNGVLRNAIRRKEELKEPTTLSDRYSHPQPLLDLLKTSMKEEDLIRMLEENNRIAPLTIQVNTLKTSCRELMGILEGEGIQAQPHSWMEDCLLLGGTGNLEQLESFRQGLYYVQDPASRLTVRCAGLTAGMQVADCCAAPGGKSFAAAIAMGNTGSICSGDIHPHKLELIARGAQRLGVSVIHPELRDGAVFEPAREGQMDAVLVDAPCSGYGIIRKKPDIRYKDPRTMEELPALQLQILSNQARYVRPGGVLLYSTCTILPRENQEVVKAFLEGHPEFGLEALPLPKPLQEDSLGMLTLLPGQYETDGFFMCRMRRMP